MKKILPILFLLLFVAATVNAADRYSVATGNWSSSATWSATSGGASGASAPVAGDNVYIEGGFTVTITTDAACANLNVSNGTLTIGNGGGDDLTVSGNIAVSLGSTIIAGNDGVLLIGGNLTNNGTFDTNNGGSDINVTFNGTANQTVSGTGGTTDFNVITVNNSGAAGSNTVEITSSNFTSTDLTLTDGNFKFSSANTLTATGTLTVPTGAGLIFNNASAVFDNGGNNGVTVSGGDFQLLSGTMNFGDGNDAFSITSGTATFSGGTFNIQGSFSMSGGTTTISGASINIDPQGSSTLGNSTNIFEATGASNVTFSSGTVTITDPHATSGTGNAVQIVSGAGTKNFTGSSIKLGDGSSTTSGSADGFDVNAGVSIGSLIINNPSGTNRTTFYVTNSPTFSGSVTITAGTLNVGTFNQTISGDWSNSGTYTSGTQTTTFNGSVAQAVGGSNATTFSSLTINNTSPTGVTLSKDVTVTGTLTLTDGIVYTSSSPSGLLSLSSTGSLSGSGSAASHISGPMARTGSTSFDFPVGNGTLYRPLGISSLSGSLTFTASYTQANPQTTWGTSLAAGIDHIGACEYWELSRTEVSGSAFVKLNFGGSCNSAPYVDNPSSLLVARWTGSTWANEGTDGTATTTSVRSLAAVSSFSPFTMGSSDAFNPLPVKLSNIKAYEKMNGVQIDWTAYQEENLSRYAIEHSADGRNFNAIGEVPARNADAETQYGFFDANPVQGVNFYRLRSIDLDGKFALSTIVKVNLDKDVKEISVYPNPATSGYISFQGADLAKGNYTVKIYNSAGAQVFSQNFTHSGGAISQTLRLPAAVRSGMYSLQLFNNDVKLLSKTFMVQ